MHTWSEVKIVLHRGVVRPPAGAEGTAAALLAAAAAAVAAVHIGVSVECALIAGTPVRALLERGRTARLLVVGHRGTDPGTGMLHGSTSKALVGFRALPGGGHLSAVTGLRSARSAMPCSMVGRVLRRGVNGDGAAVEPRQVRPRRR